MGGCQFKKAVAASKQLFLIKGYLSSLVQTLFDVVVVVVYYRVWFPEPAGCQHIGGLNSELQENEDLQIWGLPWSLEKREGVLACRKQSWW